MPNDNGSGKSQTIQSEAKEFTGLSISIILLSKLDYTILLLLFGWFKSLCIKPPVFILFFVTLQFSTGVDAWSHLYLLANVVSWWIFTDTLMCN